MFRIPSIVVLTAYLFIGAGNSVAQVNDPAAAPRTVEIGLYLIDISTLDERNETYAAELDVVARWHDPALAFEPVTGEDLPRVISGAQAEAFLDTIWDPHLFAVNRVTRAADIRPIVLLGPDGAITYRVRFRNTMRAQLDFRMFPFDRQALPLHVESLVYDSDDVALVAEMEFTGFDPAFEMSEWQVTDLTTANRLVERRQEKRTYDRLSFLVHIQRQSGYYIWKIMLPIIVIVMISWIVFWMSEEMLGRRAGVSATGMLTVIAYQFVVAGNLPRFPYQTTLDWFMLASLLVIAATMMVNLVGSRTTPGRRLALDRACRIIFPVVYSLAVVFVLIRGIGSP